MNFITNVLCVNGRKMSSIANKMNKQSLVILPLGENHILSHFNAVDSRNLGNGYFLAEGVVKSSISPQSSGDLDFPFMVVGDIQSSMRA